MSKYILITIAACLIFGGCIKDSSRIIYYNKYGDKDQLISKNLFKVKRDFLKGIDSISVFINERFVLSFKEKTVDNQGVFRICDDSLLLTHSFLDTLSTFKYCLNKQPFLNARVKLIGSKEYFVSEKLYKIYSYLEDNGEYSTYFSYYIQGIGVICIYNFGRDEYIVGDSTNIKSIPLKEITNVLVHDTIFFAKHTQKKAFPNFYRTNGYE